MVAPIPPLLDRSAAVVNRAPSEWSGIYDSADTRQIGTTGITVQRGWVPINLRCRCLSAPLDSTRFAGYFGALHDEWHCGHWSVSGGVRAADAPLSYRFSAFVVVIVHIAGA